jgi:predicted alpha/beta superfamily hydrolase
MPRPFTLESKQLATAYHLAVADVGAGGPRRLVIVLDADDQFEPAVAAAEAAAAAGPTPPLLLLGVGYGGGYRSRANRRGRDYTPSRRPDEPMENGGAGAFHGFLTDELLPWATDRFEFVAGDLGITGYSLSALFVLYALFRPRPFFRRGLAASPSIWWDDRKILDSIKTYRPGPHSPPARLFLSVGEDDSPSMTGDLALFTARLAAAPRSDLAWTEARFPGLDHYSALPASFRSGFAWLFAPPAAEA